MKPRIEMPASVSTRPAVKLGWRMSSGSENRATVLLEDR